MGTISSGVGIISGLPINDIVQKLMAIERRPVDLLKSRVDEITQERTALKDISARLLSLKAAIVPFKSDTFFKSATATSSDPAVLKVSASGDAVPGVHRLIIRRLATTHQMISDGVADPDRTPLGVGTVTVTLAAARLDRSTPLAMLNDQQGVGRGRIEIIDRSGARAEIDLTDVATVQDVLDAINGASGVRVRAEVSGDRIVITDLSGGTSSPLIVSDLAGGTIAADLGIAGSSDNGQIVGADINTISEQTPLDLLNDGNGVRRHGALADFRITASDGTSFEVALADYMNVDTPLAVLNGGLGVRLGTVRVTDRTGTTTEVDLSGAQTVGDVINAIQNAAQVSVTISGNKLLVADKTGYDGGELVIEDVTGHAAADLGIAGTSDSGSIIGEEVYSIRTIGDVIRAINYAAGNNGAVTASLDTSRKALVLIDNTSGSGTLQVEALNGSHAVEDLGLTGTANGGTLTGGRLIAGLNTTLIRSLNGGKGIAELGQIRIRDRAGNESVIDLSAVQTVAELIDAINNASGSAQVRAQISASGLGIVLVDESGGTGQLVVEDVTGTAAADLGIAGQVDSDRIEGKVLYKKFLSESTRLSQLNGGRGVAKGKFRITDSSGKSAVIDLSSGDNLRLRDVLDKINSAPISVEARINDTGDGIIIVDKAGGGNPLKVEDIDSTTASDLNIAGQAGEGENYIDGRLSVQIDVAADDGLNDLLSKLGAADHLLAASVINDGSPVRPYRLLVTAKDTGTRGALAIDVAGLSLQLSTLVEAEDATVIIGEHAAAGLSITSSSNQIDGVIPGVTLSLLSRSDSPVDVTISQDTDALVEQFQTFAERFNDVIDRIEELTKYNPETEERGVLLGDSTVEVVRSRLYSLTRRIVANSGSYRSLADIGFRVGDGAHLEFDEDAFRRAYEADPQAVQQLLSGDDGLAAKLEEVLDDLTDPAEGVLGVREETLRSREELFNKRIDQMNELLSIKEEQLYAQFRAMEAALAQLQAQQAALASFTVIPPNSVSLGSLA